MGYIWRPTGRTFTIVGNARPLTRITTTIEVPSRKLIVLESESPKPVVNLVCSRKPRKNKNTESVSKTKVIKPMSANKQDPSKSWGSTKTNVPSTSLNECRLSKSSSVKFGNDQVAKIMGYGDYQIGNVTISRVYYVEGLGHNLFSVGQFCDSNLEVAFRQHTCFIRNLEGVDLLTGSRGDNLYTLSLGNMMASSPICLLSKASKTKSWLWHRRLSHLNFGAINHLARHGLVRGLPKLKFEKDHLCSACALGKSSKKPHKPKSEDTNQEKLYLLHMDLCGPMRVASVNGKKYILVIVDDYSRFTWVKCLRSKDEAPAFIINFLKMIQVRLKETVRRIRTDNGTEFVNQTLREYYEKVGISHETSVARSPQQNGVVERRNRTLIEAARTMLIYAKAPLFLWAEAVATACYTQNRSMIRRRHGKTPYELLHDKPPDLSYLHVFGALCYPTNDSENLGKLQPKPTDGFVDPDKPNHVYKLKKALYGLKQAPRAWYDMLSSFLISNDFSKGSVDPTLFMPGYLTPMVEKSKLDEDKEGKAVDPSHIIVLVPSKSRKALRISSYGKLENCFVRVGLLKSKHIDIRFHFIKEHVENGVIELYFVNTEYQLADIFTKALGRERIEFLINKLGMRRGFPPTNDDNKYLDDTVQEYEDEEQTESDDDGSSNPEIKDTSYDPNLLVNPDVNNSSSSISSGFVSNMRNPNQDTVYHHGPSFTAQINRPPTPYPLVIQTQQPPILTPATTTSSSLQNLPNFASLFGFDYRLKALEDNFSELRQTNQYAEALSSIPSTVDQYLANKMQEAVDVAVQLKYDRIREESTLQKFNRFLHSIDDGMKKIIKEQEANTSHAIAANLSELELKKILIDKMGSYNSNQQAYCHNLKDPRYGADEDQNPPLEQPGSKKEDTQATATNSASGRGTRQPTDVLKELQTRIRNRSPWMNKQKEETENLPTGIQQPTRLPPPDQHKKTFPLAVHNLTVQP
ncbi:retrovirus-related pol polyprotein from transposon TNT 1-94 [Tanacetum coccineum]